MSCFCPTALGKVQGKPWLQRGWETGPKDGERSYSVRDGDWHLVTSFTATECGAWCEGTGCLLLGMAKIYQELWWQTLEEKVLEGKYKTLMPQGLRRSSVPRQESN